MFYSWLVLMGVAGDLLSTPHSAPQVDTHWSEKSLSTMTERDWRIFREDFNIAYRGHNPTHPMRNWEEADLPRELRKVRALWPAG